MLFCETHDLVWEIISVSEKRMKNCIVKIINNVFEKNDEGGLFPLNNEVHKHVLLFPRITQTRINKCIKVT